MGTTATAPTQANAKLMVNIIYAGLTKTFEPSPHETVEALLQQALNAFSITNNRHTMSLYSSAGVELADNQSLEAAGIKSGDALLLRPSQVKGGAADAIIIARDFDVHATR